MEGIYLYAIALGAPQLDLPPIGLPDGATPVTTRSATDLTAVVSRYDGAAPSDLSRADILQRLLVHQQVLEQIIADLTVLPVQFGTILSSTEEVETVLSRYHSRLQGALREVGDAVEINLSASWEPVSVMNEISREPDVVAMVGAAGAGGTNDLATQLRIGQLVHETLRARREQFRRRIVGELVEHTRDAEPNPLASDELVMNVAFLVDRSRLAAFDATVDRLGEEFGDTLTFRYVGPLAPYSFATVQITQPQGAEIAEAAQVLGLGQEAGEDDVRAAYRRLAAEHHPDRNPGDSSAQERFAAISAAHDVLQAYIRGLKTEEGNGTDPAQFDLRPDHVSRQALLTVTRAHVDAGGAP